MGAGTARLMIVVLVPIAAGYYANKPDDDFSSPHRTI